MRTNIVSLRLFCVKIIGLAFISTALISAPTGYAAVIPFPVNRTPAAAPIVNIIQKLNSSDIGNQQDALIELVRLIFAAREQGQTSRIALREELIAVLKNLMMTSPYIEISLGSARVLIQLEPLDAQTNEQLATWIFHFFAQIELYQNLPASLLTAISETARNQQEAILTLFSEHVSIPGSRFPVANLGYMIREPLLAAYGEVVQMRSNEASLHEFHDWAHWMGQSSVLASADACGKSFVSNNPGKSPDGK